MPRSSPDAGTASDYETAWAAISERIDGYGSWSGRERNICYLNNRDGTFSDISAAASLDFVEDGRSFAAADLDGDGDLDLAVKSRNSPTLRIIRNDWAEQPAVTVRLIGTQSNSNAVGAQAAIRSGDRIVRRSVRAGSGFLSQHAKELHFGVGADSWVDELRVRWPSGSEQVFPGLRPGQRVTIVEGSETLEFAELQPIQGQPEIAVHQTQAGKPGGQAGSGIWLIEPVAAPGWDLPAMDGSRNTLAEYRGSTVLLNIWASWCPPCRSELADLEQQRHRLERAGIRVAAVSVDDSATEAAARDLVQKIGPKYPALVADHRFRSAYSTLVPALLGRRSEMSVPTSLLINDSGLVEKVYMGTVDVDGLLADSLRLGEPVADRLLRAIPFPGEFLGPRPRRDFTRLGAEMLDVGLLETATRYFRASIRQAPGHGPGHYNLGTAQAALGNLDLARASFETAVRLSPAHAAARNSLGVVLGRMGRDAEALEWFRSAIASRPGYSKAIANLARTHERLGENALAVQTLESGASANPRDAHLRNLLGTLHARLGKPDLARTWLREALALAPGDPVTLTNLALLEAQRGNLAQSEGQLQKILAKHPKSGDALLGLARVQVAVGKREAAGRTLATLLAMEPRNRAARQLRDSIRP